jgi:hypothetical protein
VPPPQVPVADPQDLRRRHQLIFFAIACNITSCTFIARSIAAFG